MSDPKHHQLLGYLLGALDDDEQQRLDASLEHNEADCRAMADWRRRLAPLEAMRPDYEPRPGLAMRTCRYVAEHIPVPAGLRARWRMSPAPAVFAAVGRIGWLDVAAVVCFAVVISALAFPAIVSSRFHASVAACQDNLRRFGLAMEQYSHDQHSPMGRLAGNGRLTAEGVSAAALLRTMSLGESGRNICPDAWLIAQGAAGEYRLVNLVGGVTGDGLDLSLNEGRPVAMEGPRLSAYAKQDWPGTWRDGTTGGSARAPPTPAVVPLLADAPSADLPGQDAQSHGGLGRNVLFEGGRVSFVPSAVVRQPGDVDLVGGRAFSASSSGISQPIVFVSSSAGGH